MSDVSYIYILVRPDRCKIGRSTNANRRTRDIASAAGLDDARMRIAFPVLPALASQIEKSAHRALSRHWLKGEWFDVSWEKAAEAVEEAMVKVTRENAVGPIEATNRRKPIDLTTPAGRALIRDRLERL